jgi:Tol biopolymer transport system component
MTSMRMRSRLPLIGLGLLVVAAWLAPRPSHAQAAKRAGRSHVTLINADGTDRRVIYSADQVFEAPNWTPDGKDLILNSQGRLWRLPVAGGVPALVDTGNVKKLNNDHGISPDGSLLAISAGQIYVLPAAGGVPRQVTEQIPSYYHGWSPDGRTLAYCARRGENFDLFAIDVNGGPERRLTEHAGYDDGPDYSPDGRWIYFNSDRSGSWDIWRIPAAGAGAGDAQAERITQDEYEDWFPHPSPDGRWMVFLSFAKGTKGHPPDQQVVLRRMPMPGNEAGASAGPITEVVQLFGGQGTMNVNSWAPDSRRFAYVSYEATGQDAAKPAGGGGGNAAPPK